MAMTYVVWNIVDIYQRSAISLDNSRVGLDNIAERLGSANLEGDILSGRNVLDLQS